MMDIEKRDINLDLIRSVAVFGVISVHFFLNSGFYSEIVDNSLMYLGVIIRTIFMYCVPLFLLLTGYLKNNKVLSKGYWWGIKKIIAIYVLSTVAILIYRKFILDESFGVGTAILNITSFQQYSWYVEMYIGLFLLIPFLNLVYRNLTGIKEKMTLIVVLFCLVSLPSLVNQYDIFTDGWFMLPSQSTAYNEWIPSWWTFLYPLLYYYIGAFICEYRDQIRLSQVKVFLLLILFVVLFGLYNCWRSYGAVFIWGEWSNWQGFQNVIIASFLFFFLLRLPLSGIPIILKKLVYHISRLSLGIYLVSWIFDQYFYTKLIDSVGAMEDRFSYFFIIVPLVFLCSFVLSAVIDRIYVIGDGLWKKMKLRYRKKQIKQSS